MYNSKIRGTMKLTREPVPTDRVDRARRRERKGPRGAQPAARGGPDARIDAPPVYTPPRVYDRSDNYTWPPRRSTANSALRSALDPTHTRSAFSIPLFINASDMFSIIVFNNIKTRILCKMV